MPPAARRVVIYARLSVSTEESVSIRRQIESARAYCVARGWDAVGVFCDDGVSATKNAPGMRQGWRDLMATEGFELVVVWKLDRLTRRITDFVDVLRELEARGASLVTVEDGFDLSTDLGVVVAHMLAIFGEYEAKQIAARVTAARHTIIKSGRRAGGRPPYGWVNVPNPDGPGMVLAKDPERIGWVEQMARRAMSGESIHSLARWMSTGAPERAARTNRKHAHWPDSSVESILLNPVLAGMVPWQPGRGPGTRSDPRAVLLGADGTPVVDEGVAILTLAERAELLAVLEGAKRPGSRPNQTPSLLSGLLRCSSCAGPLHRGSANGQYAVYRCQNRGCPRQVEVSRVRLEEHLEALILAHVGDRRVPMLEYVTTADPDEELARIKTSIDALKAQMDAAADRAERSQLFDRIQSLYDDQEQARLGVSRARPTAKMSGRVLAKEWAAAGDNVEAKATLLRSVLEYVEVSPTTRRGRGFDTSRVAPKWRELSAPERDDAAKLGAQVVMGEMLRGLRPVRSLLVEPSASNGEEG